MRHVLWLCLLASVSVSAQVRMRDSNPPVVALQIVTATPLTTVIEDVALDALQVCVVATGGTAPYTYAITSGSAPTGTSLEAGGCFSGTPTTAGTTTGIVITVTDAVMATANKTFSWTIQASAALPSPWVCASVGVVSPAGTCSEKSGAWTIVAPGDTSGTADNFGWAYQQVTGDYYIIAEVTSCTTAGPFAQECGIRVSQSLLTGSTTVMCVFSDSGSNGYGEWRTTSNGAISSAPGATTTTGWVRIRVYNGIPDCAFSDDGLVWDQVAISSPPTFTGAWYLGMKVDGTNLGVATGVFDNVEVDVYEPPVSGSDFNGYRSYQQGHGADTLGGMSGETRTCRVTTLTISGSPTWGATGDAEDCMEGLPTNCVAYTGTRADCARFVLFDVSGFINLRDAASDQITVTGPYLTVLGQTSPTCAEGSAVGGSAECVNGSGGIVFTNDGAERNVNVCSADSNAGNMVIDTHDVVLQHLAFDRHLQGCYFFVRFGDSDGALHPHHIILDHVTIMHGQDQAMLQIPGAALRSILVTDSLIAEALWFNATGGYGSFFFHPSSGCAVGLFRNVWAHNNARAPWLNGGCQYLFVNNLTFNTSDTMHDNELFTGFGLIDSNYGGHGASSYVAQSNDLIDGPTSGHSRTDTFGFSIHPDSLSAGVAAYLNDNTGPGITGASGNNQWAGAIFGDYCNADGCGSEGYENAASEVSIRVNTMPGWASTFLSNEWIENTSNAVRTYLVGDCPAGVKGNNGNAGARPKDRHNHAKRVLCDILEDDGTWALNWNYIANNYGGLPTIVTRTWDSSALIPASPGAAGDCGNILVGGTPTPRTKLMCSMETRAQALEYAQGPN